MRWLATFSILLLALPGCASSGSPPPVQPGATQAVASLATATSAEPPTPASNPPDAKATTWFLHVTPAGTSPVTGKPNCTYHVEHMDGNDTAGDCDGHGRRNLPLGNETTCGAQCFPADHGAGPYPAGTPVAGTIYVGADAVDDGALEVQLLSAGTIVGAVLQAPQPIVSIGGGTFQPFPFSFSTGHAIGANATLELRVIVHAKESYFLGFEGDHASRFTLGPPGGAGSAG